MGKVATEATLESIRHSVRVIEAGLTGIVEDMNDYDEILAIIRRDGAAELLPIGSQINTMWGAYENPFDIVDHNEFYVQGNATPVPGLMMCQHFANVAACPFDPQEALYDADTELPAGTYTFEVAGDTWLTTENGKIMQFTLTKPIPAGGQIVYANQEGYNQVLAGQSIRTYSAADSFTDIETAVLSEVGEVGANHLGKTDGSALLNHHQAAFRGSGRWATSMLRQYLNTALPKGTWWRKQAKWDRSSAFATNNDGYMMSLPENFVRYAKPVRVQTARNTVNLDGGTDVTYDRFFPLSLEQVNVAPQIAGVEGGVTEYYKTLAEQDTTGNLDTNGRFKQYGTYPDLIKYSLSNHNTARACWLRSASRGSSSGAWLVYSSGDVGTSNALSGFYVAPACVIC